jgi:DNA helicase II / ATP-dependent DNA helicase PcrA
MILDKVQQDIVNCKDKNIIAVAGAGSGKTRVLTERVKRLLLDGVEPSNIVVITFTNMAADEMRERLLGVPGIGDAFVGTIHSFANKLMKNSDEVYEIYSDEKENNFARTIIRRYCKHLTYDRFLEYKDIKYKVDMGMLSEDAVGELILPSENAEITRIFGKPDDEFKQTIPSMCEQANVITFDVLLKKSTDYFKSLNARVEHVLVDELQDIGYLEYTFIKGLNAENYFFVGDDWQAIYGFKGGDVNIFLNLIRNADWTTFYMNMNYRSKQLIISKAAQVIRQVDDLIDKEVEAFCKESGEVKTASKYQLRDIVRKVSKEDYKEYFLLVRTNKQLFEVSQILDSENIPYSSFRKGTITLAEMREELELNTIKLLTVHTAKGLESKNVILYGEFPMTQPSYLKNDDERKVMYVGMTRAKDRLIILN